MTVIPFTDGETGVEQDGDNAPVFTWLARLRSGPQRADAKAGRFGHPATSQSTGPRPFWCQGPVSWKTIFPQTGEGGDGLGMIQARHIYRALYSWCHYISPPRIIRPGTIIIQEAGDPVLEAVMECSSPAAWDRFVFTGAGVCASLGWLFLFVKRS